MINPQFPIIFESIRGECKQADGSFYNPDEMKAVLIHIRKLLDCKMTGMGFTDKDIGIVSPYRSQCDRLRTMCKAAKYDNITVGTAEVFQGQERPIMVISTVRTGGKLGFMTEKVRQWKFV